MIIAIRGLCNAQSPIFYTSARKLYRRLTPQYSPLPRKKNNAEPNQSFNAKPTNECCRHSKARLTMLGNSNFRPVFRNTLLLTTPTSVLYSVTRSTTNTHKYEQNPHKSTSLHQQHSITGRKNSYILSKIKSLITIRLQSNKREISIFPISLQYSYKYANLMQLKSTLQEATDIN